ncbi:hypothetical protein H4P12_13775 [Paracoccus sp. 11-3]|uniref:Uncharacterized protein n=1 Tax=Paracoccus amoyensis TaxID=2760093 RepID=A0A926GCZ8_9RHOB|nr:hypothetical protein [Paracoccus amoyensis]MBC9247746.1 hypothetical protein [Paracoccus amoyensis]
MSIVSIFTRSFHPDKNFGAGGLGFERDNRDFSLQRGVTSRIYHIIDIDLTVGKIVKVFCDSDHSQNAVAHHAVNAAVDAAETVSHSPVRSLGTGLALAPGNLYVNYPDASGQRQVRSFYVGPPSSSADFYIQVGGGGSAGKQHWDMIYYIVIKAGDLPGQGAAETLGRRVLRQAVRSSSFIIRRGFGLLTLGGAGYDVTVRVGRETYRNQFLDQEVLSEEGMARIREAAEDVWEYMKE